MERAHLRTEAETLKWLKLATPTTPLIQQLRRCGERQYTGRNFYRHECGQYACLWCRARFVNTRIRFAIADLAHVAHDRLVSVTVNAPSVSGLPLAIENLTRVRQVFRNCARSRRWADIRATGGLALDVLPSDLNRAASPSWEDAGTPIWTVALHAVVELPARGEWQRLRDDLLASRVVERVEALPFGNHGTAEQIAAAVRRPFEHYGVSAYKADGQDRLFQWPIGWFAEALNAIHRAGGGLRPMTYSRGFKAIPAPQPERMAVEVEPMPMFIGGWWND